MNQKTKIITIVLAILLLATGIAVSANYSHSKERLALLEKQEILLYENGIEVCSITFSDLNEIVPTEFQADLKSSAMMKPEAHSYTGVPLPDLFTYAGISLEDKSRVIAGSLDGYRVPLKIEEIVALDNVFLVYKDDGEFLKTYDEPEGQGPYMIVVRGDRFSQRWAKYVVELNAE